MVKLTNIWGDENSTPTTLLACYYQIGESWVAHTVAITDQENCERFAAVLGNKHTGTTPDGVPWKLVLEELPDNVLDLLDQYIDDKLAAPYTTGYVVACVAQALTARAKIKEYLG